jgi:hypothetical protein
MSQAARTIGQQETSMSLGNTSQPSVKYCADKVNAKYIWRLRS